MSYGLIATNSGSYAGQYRKKYNILTIRLLHQFTRRLKSNLQHPAYFLLYPSNSKSGPFSPYSVAIFSLKLPHKSGTRTIPKK